MSTDLFRRYTELWHGSVIDHISVKASTMRCT